MKFKILKTHPTYFLFIFLLSICSLYSQDSKNVTLVYKFAEGPCFGIASTDSVLFIGNGCSVDIAKIQHDSSLKKVNQLICDYLINSLKFSNNILYAATEGGLYLVDASDINHPRRISFFPTTGNCPSVFIKNNFVYFVDDKIGFSIINISEISNPYIISTFQLTTKTMLNQICATDSTVFLCDSRGELSVINVKEKTKPELVSTYNFLNRFYPNTIAVKDSFAFVGTTSKQSPYELGSMFVLDISTPTSVKNIRFFPIPGDWTSSGRYIEITDTTLLLSFSSDVGKGVDIYSISNPSLPKVLNTVSNNGINSIYNVGGYQLSQLNELVFVADGGNGLKVFSISDINKPRMIYHYKTGDTINDLFASNNRLYSVGGYSNLNIFDIYNLEQIRKISNNEIVRYDFGYRTSVFVDNNFYAFITNTPHSGNGLQIVSVQKSDSTFEVGRADEVEGNKVIVKDNYAYVAARFCGLFTYDISNYSQPKLISKLPFEISGYDLEIYDNKCFLAAASKGIYIYDISLPNDAKEFLHFNPGDITLGVAVKDSIVFTAAREKGLRIFNYNNSSINTLFNEEFTFVRKVRLHNNFLYLIDDSKGLVILDITELFNPKIIGYYSFDTKNIALNLFVKDNLIFLSQGNSGFTILRNDLITSIKNNNDQKPINFDLSQNFPNPFNPTTTIKYQLPVDGNVSLKIYNVLGVSITTLIERKQERGNYEIEFDAGDLPSGVYFYQLNFSGNLLTRKMLLVK